VTSAGRFIASHVEAGTHPKLVQERVGYSNMHMTMDVDGKLPGKMALGEEQAVRLDTMASETSLTLVNTWSTGASKTGRNNENQPETRTAIGA
jgi:hypothetical protein